MDLLLEIWLCLLVAALLGGIIGWLLRGVRCRRDTAALEATWKATEADLRGRFEAIHSERDGYRHEVENLESSVASFKSDLVERERAIADLEGRRDQAAASLSLKTDEAAAFLASLDTVRAELGTSQSEVETRAHAIAKLKSERDAANGVAEAKTREAGDLGNQVQELQTERATLRAELTARSERIAALEADHQQALNAMQVSSDDRERLDEELASLRQSLGSARVRISELEQALAAREPEASGPSDEDAARLRELEDRLRTTREALEDCRRQHSAATPVAAPIDSEVLARRDARIAELENELANLDRLAANPDDLKEISGVGTVLETMLNGIGVFTFRQIANWDEADIAWATAKLDAFQDRITRDDWVTQARQLYATKRRAERADD